VPELDLFLFLWFDIIFFFFLFFFFYSFLEWIQRMELWFLVAYFVGTTVAVGIIIGTVYFAP
jgi:hypothetical protein